MNSYDGLYILTLQGSDDSYPDIIKQIEKELQAQGCEIETVQKLDKREFERPNNKHSSGYYVNFRFRAKPETIANLRAKFKFNPAIYRQFYVKRKPSAVAA